MAIGVLLTLVALVWSAQAGAAVYKGKGKSDPKVKVSLVAGKKQLFIFKPKYFKVRFDDKDRTSGRSDFTDDRLNTKDLDIERRPNRRRRFVERFDSSAGPGAGTAPPGGGTETGIKEAKIDIAGSLNRSRTRARGWFKLRIVVGPDEPLPEGTMGTTGRVPWVAKRRKCG